MSKFDDMVGKQMRFTKRLVIVGIVAWFVAMAMVVVGVVHIIDAAPETIGSFLGEVDKAREVK